jgi:hypothetical protein
MPAESHAARWIRCAVLVCMPCIGCGGEVALNGLAPVDTGPPEDTTRDAHLSEMAALDATTDPHLSDMTALDATTEISSEPDEGEDAAQGAPCGPANCQGCCDSAGSCQLGDQSDKCGLSGVACSPCPEISPVCRQGSCWVAVGMPPCMGSCGGSDSSSGSSSGTLTCSGPSDCPSSAPICCAMLAQVPDAMNDLPPQCVNTILASSCASACKDSPPTDATTCRYPPAGTGMVRLCNHDVDCATDPATPGAGCYNFNSAPISWCSTSTAGLLGVHQP